MQGQLISDKQMYLIRFGISNNNGSTFQNDGGSIIIDNTNLQAIINWGLFENINNGQILIGQNDGNLDDVGIDVTSGTFVNDNSTIIIDKVKEEGISNSSNFTNKNNGQILIGQNGNVGGLGLFNGEDFINDDAIIRIDDGLYGIYNYDDNTLFENKNGGQIFLGTNGNFNSLAIQNNDNAEFKNNSCSYLYVGNKRIENLANFVNDGIIIEDTGDPHNISTNNGIVQNLNGGSFTINTNNGTYTTEDLKIWTGCQSEQWYYDDNWHDEVMPTQTDDVLVAELPLNDIFIDNNSIFRIKSITLEVNAHLTVTSSGTMKINGSSADGIYNSGTIENNGTIEIGISNAIGQDGIDNRGHF